MTHKTIIIIDGNSLVNRAYFAIPSLSNKEGVPTNAVYGFLSMLFKLIGDYNPDYLSVAFDLKGPTFRHKQYEEYKATRKGMPDDLAVQMPILKEVLDALGIHRTELQGFEADDLIGTLATQCSQNEMNVLIVTGDKDALQLVNDRTKVLLTKQGITKLAVYDAELIKEEFDLVPDQIRDYKGLSGDASDNIPGIPGVGPKTAIKLLNEFVTVENLIQHMDQIENKRIRELVSTYGDKALMSKRLATIEKYVPIEYELSEFEMRSQDDIHLVELFKKYGFNSFLKQVKPAKVETSNDEKDSSSEFKIVCDPETVKSVIEGFHFPGEVGIFCIYDKIDLRTDKLIGLGLYSEDKGAYYLEILDEPDLIQAVGHLVTDPTIRFVGHDIKNDCLIMLEKGFKIANVHFDTKVAAYLLEPERSKYHLTDLALEYALNIEMPTDEDVLGKGVKKTLFAFSDPSLIAKYGALSAKAAFKLNKIMEAKMEEENLNTLMQTVEMPLITVLTSLEFEGFNVDFDELNRIDHELTTKIDEITAEIYDHAGVVFNISSPKQLGEILFEKLDLPVDKKTKTGYSTSHDVLEKLEKKHPIVPLVMEYRTYTKLKSTYIDGLRQVINPVTKKVHTSLNQTVAATGRLSSTEPNLQNIPIRLAIGRKLRKLFIPSAGNLLLDADYSQIELRVLAHMSQDENLLYAFNNNFDVHTITASQVFEIKPEEVTSLERSRAKEVNFGIIYGMSDFGLSENLGISRKMAKEYIEQYFRKYPKVKGFMDEVLVGCREHKYVTTLLNRRRYIHDITNKNFNLRGFAERIAMNTPIQGTAADIIKAAMVRVHHELEGRGLKSKLILQVHDELLIDVFPEELNVVKEILRECMENPLANILEFSVPLSVDMKEGSSWYETK